ncbi:MAG: hypothetical protein PHO02_04325 [Candidatus Nanoarchaeia archaeon]|nr:hypothetical protein [Candidatus Nanoarchaeia archaeon]
MKAIKTLLGAGCLAAALGCGNGYGIDNSEPVEDNILNYQLDLSREIPDYRIRIPVEQDNEWRPEPQTGIPGPRVPRLPFNPGNADDPTQAYGWGVYCIRKQTPGSTHFGVLANYDVSDKDGINEMGLVAYGERTMERFRQQYPDGVTEAEYNFAKRNYGVNGDEDVLALYVIDNEGNQTEFALKPMSCEALDKLLEPYRL